MRRSFAWALLTLGLLTAAIWGASHWWMVGHSSPPWFLSLEKGEIAFWRQHPPGIAFAPIPNNINRSFVGPVYKGREAPSRWITENKTRLSQIARTLTVWLVRRVQVPGRFDFWVAPIWPFSLLLVCGGALLLWPELRAKRWDMTGRCAACGYDLAGLGADPKCPECGKGAAGA